MLMLKRFIASILALLPLLSYAQKDDFGLWVGADISKKLSSSWSIEAEAEYRMADNVSTTDRISAGLSAAYKPTKWLKAEAGYNYLHTRLEGGVSSGGSYYNSSYWCPRHRVFAGITGQWKLSKRLKISLRERWVYTYRPSYDLNRMNINSESSKYGEVSQKYVAGKCKNVLRSKVSLSYNIKGSKFEPFASVEMYNSLGSGNNSFGTVEKLRYSAGTEYKLDKKNSVELYYLFQDFKDNDDNEPNGAHIVGIGYSHSF